MLPNFTTQTDLNLHEEHSKVQKTKYDQMWSFFIFRPKRKIAANAKKIIFGRIKTNIFSVSATTTHLNLARSFARTANANSRVYFLYFIVIETFWPRELPTVFCSLKWCWRWNSHVNWPSFCKRHQQWIRESRNRMKFHDETDPPSIESRKSKENNNKIMRNKSSMTENA